jgi:fido (protein-threonine AMPylation protein)
MATGEQHAYAPVDQVAPEMQRLMETLKSPEFGRAHPVIQASWAHYAFVAIHPFADGNGRVARALASAYLYRPNSVPFLMSADQRTPYFDALSAAQLPPHRRVAALRAGSERGAGAALAGASLAGLHAEPLHAPSRRRGRREA